MDELGISKARVAVLEQKVDKLTNALLDLWAVASSLLVSCYRSQEMEENIKEWLDG